MADWPDGCIDTVICDPPYGLGFMGKDWDSAVPSVEVFTEILRVAKPGAFLLCFAGTRTWDIMGYHIRQAGWQIRDTIMWLYGSGFPKSLNIGKAIDKSRGAVRRGAGSQGNTFPLEQTYETGDPVTSEAKLWSGYGTALKPAFEPIIVAMKPIEGTFAENALKHGVAGLNIDGGRIAYQNEKDKKNTTVGFKLEKCQLNPSQKWGMKDDGQDYSGRFPANVILDEEAATMLDEQAPETGGGHWSGKVPDGGGLYKLGLKPMEDKGSDGTYSGASRFFYTAKSSKAERNVGCGEMKDHKPCYESHRPNYENTKGIETPFAGTGRGGKGLKNNHPTVKPLDLMEYLCRLTKTPTGGIVLDPFIGSGTTACACINTGRDFIGIEREPDYCRIAEARIKAIKTGVPIKQQVKEKGQIPLFPPESLVLI